MKAIQSLTFIIVFVYDWGQLRGLFEKYPCSARKCIFMPISTGKKGILTLVIRGWNLRNNRDRHNHKEKTKRFSQCPPSVRLSAKFLYPITDKDNCMRFSLFERCIPGIDPAKISRKSHEYLRSWSRMKFLTTLLYLMIRLIKSIRTLFILKILTRK